MGKTYYFCNQMCKEKFDKNPTKYISACGHSERSMHSGHCC
ncbi:MAG: YHS domain-containing protein [Candidatus Bathyarchaeota archaeon]|nr:YHS domain-containing protein [Candidatus Bathyarchaeota archaeon]